MPITLNRVHLSIGVSEAHLRDLGDSVQQGALVRRRVIGKRGGGLRTIVVAEPVLQEVLKKLLRFFYTLDPRPHPKVNGFVPKTSTLRNAVPHVAKAVVLHLDLADFFGSVRRDHVQEVLTDMDFNKDAVVVLTNLIHTPHGLPQGFATSPYVATLALRPLDYLCESIAKNRGLEFSRYADDLTFSGDNIDGVIQAVIDACDSTGWALNPEKTRVQRRGSRQYVSGLTVVDGQQPRIPRKIKRRYRAKSYKIRTQGYEAFMASDGREEDRTRRLRGMLQYIRSVEPDFADKILAEIDHLLPSDLPDEEDAVTDAPWDAD